VTAKARLSLVVRLPVSTVEATLGHNPQATCFALWITAPNRSRPSGRERRSRVRPLLPYSGVGSVPHRGDSGGERRVLLNLPRTRNGVVPRRASCSEGVAVHDTDRVDGVGVARRLRSWVRDVPALTALVPDVRGRVALYGLRSSGVGAAMSIFTGDWSEVSPPLITYHRDLLITHADDLVTQVCAVCLMQQCPDWRAAREWLLAADELTVPAPHHAAMAQLDRKPRS
jgi:hypothetical protein